MENAASIDVEDYAVDYVVVPDADAEHYPLTLEARRMLYVAITRARHQLVLACTGVPTPCVPYDDARGLVRRTRQRAKPRITRTGNT